MNTSLDSDYDPLEIGDEVPGLNDGSDSDSEDDDLFDWICRIKRTNLNLELVCTGRQLPEISLRGLQYHPWFESF